MENNIWRIRHNTYGAEPFLRSRQLCSHSRRIRQNEEVNTLLKGEDIVRFIKSQRIIWLYSTRRKGRPRMRWLDDIEIDLKMMKAKGWKVKMRNREQWRLVVEEAKGHPGLWHRR
jgi:hypothetical protein